MNQNPAFTSLSRRSFLKTMSAASLSLSPLARAERISGLASPDKLTPLAFCMLPLGEVRPTGWLQRQLRIQADGLGGHLDETWADVGSNSGWLGGAGESWERGPYFLDGLVPLAFLTENPALIAKVKKWLNWTLDHQTPEG